MITSCTKMMFPAMKFRVSDSFLQLVFQWAFFSSLIIFSSGVCFDAHNQSCFGGLGGCNSPENGPHFGYFPMFPTCYLPLYLVHPAQNFIGCTCSELLFMHHCMKVCHWVHSLALCKMCPTSLVKCSLFHRCFEFLQSNTEKWTLAANQLVDSVLFSLLHPCRLVTFCRRVSTDSFESKHHGSDFSGGRIYLPQSLICLEVRNY